MRDSDFPVCGGLETDEVFGLRLTIDAAKNLLQFHSFKK